MSHALIVGCGYIGKAVAHIWKQRGLHVTGTTRNPERLDEIATVTQKGVLIKGNDEDELAPLIAANETILISIAADNVDQYESAYLNTAQLFRHLAVEMDLPRRLIYTSSTSVYGNHHGRWVDEESDLLAQSEQGKILIEAEHLYQSLAELGWHVCILRLSEIYGPGRLLSDRLRELQGHTLPGSGATYSNMVHRDDCAGAIDYALRHHLEGIYNIADDEHPTRKELYDRLAHKFKLPHPTWDPAIQGLHETNKRVSNHKIKAEGFTFRHPIRVLD